MRFGQRLVVGMTLVVLCLVVICMETGIKPLSAVYHAVRDERNFHSPAEKIQASATLRENVVINDDEVNQYAGHKLLRKKLEKSKSESGSPSLSGAKNQTNSSATLAKTTTSANASDSASGGGRNTVEEKRLPPEQLEKKAFFFEDWNGPDHRTNPPPQNKSENKFLKLMKEGPTVLVPSFPEKLVSKAPRPHSRGNALHSWEIFQYGINRYELYPHGDSNVDRLLSDMTEQELVSVEEKSGGTQVKMIIEFEDGGLSLFKPKKVSRAYETLPDHFYFSDIERHNAEIAAFHLDRVLDFRRCPPVAGRWVNLTSELYGLTDSSFKRTFFRSPAGNVCFVGHCSYYCQTETAVCGRPDKIEGSFATFLPPWRYAPRKTWVHPWRRSYSKHKLAEWETRPDYCDQVRRKHPYNSGRRLLDLMDMSVYDFLQGNMDRHHYETFANFGNFTYPIHLDHGRGFGKHATDELSILVPIQHCCLMRRSTYDRLKLLATEELRLGDVMRDAMSVDSVAPVLIEPHLQALDRRLAIILETLNQCIEEKGVEEVLMPEPQMADYHEPNGSY